VNNPISSQPLHADALKSWRAGMRGLEQASELTGLAYADSGTLTWSQQPLFYRVNRLHVLALGKTAHQLARAATLRLGGRIETGFAVTLTGKSLGRPWSVFRGGHPTVTRESLIAGAALQQWLADLGPNDHLLVLMSGGASAMVEIPSPGWSLERLAQARAQDLSAGLSIVHINQRAAQRSLSKDGRLAHRTPCAWKQLTLNDVGDAVNGCVSSGPFLGLNGDGLTIANHRTAARAATHQLTALGYRVFQAPTLKGEARSVGAGLNIPKGYNALVASGETTVVGPYQGVGGRNLELVGGWILDGQPPPSWSLVSGAADGCDGNSGAAGAYYSSDDQPELGALKAAMERHDSGTWFAKSARLLTLSEPVSHTGDLLVLVSSKGL